ncbi:MAG: hypothetical protein ACHQ7N_21695 [Candidatus Methylomirabilales bacterium]
MSDYMAGEISIGGTLKRRHVRKLCEAISDQGVQTKSTGATYRPARASDLLSARNNQGHLVLEHAELPYGIFSPLETVLQRLGLAYERTSNARYEHDGLYLFYRPGMTAPEVRYATQDGKLLVSGADVKFALALVRKGAVARAEKLLAKVTCEDLGPLPPVTIAP